MQRNILLLPLFQRLPSVVAVARTSAVVVRIPAGTLAAERTLVEGTLAGGILVAGILVEERILCLLKVVLLLVGRALVQLDSNLLRSSIVVVVVVGRSRRVW